MRKCTSDDCAPHANPSTTKGVPSMRLNGGTMRARPPPPPPPCQPAPRPRLPRPRLQPASAVADAATEALFAEPAAAAACIRTCNASRGGGGGGGGGGSVRRAHIVRADCMSTRKQSSSEAATIWLAGPGVATARDGSVSACVFGTTAIGVSGMTASGMGAATK